MLFSVMVVQTTPEGEPEQYQRVIDQVRLAEELGYDRVWLVAHHFTSFSRPASIVTAAHLAALTSRIRLGIGVEVLPLQHPLRVLEEASVLDHLSGGRVDLGVGRGIQPEAFAGFGVSMEEATARFDESLEILQKGWLQESFSHDGRFWQIPEITVLPRPLQRPHPPIWEVGVSPHSIERAARSGRNGLIGSYMNTGEEVHADILRWQSNLVQPAGQPRPLLAHNELVYIAETDQRASEEASEGGLWYSRSAGSTWRGARKPLPDDYAYWSKLSARVQKLEWNDLFRNQSLMGSVDTVSAKVERLKNWGVDELILFSSFGNMPARKVDASLRLFAERVMPQFQ
jgi:alkanesulfonate monooxygenase SsuD/methylene tetrahydromethanopterin reductase-like flavin-dependent oxidoreductase (luciferase family)